MLVKLSAFDQSNLSSFEQNNASRIDSMKFFLATLLVLTAIRTKACLGAESEKAQDRQAIVKFIGTATTFEIQKIKGHALVTFNVSKTLHGESRPSCSLIAPGEISGSKKKAFYIGDAACSMNGEDWLLQKIETNTREGSRNSSERNISSSAAEVNFITETTGDSRSFAWQIDSLDWRAGQMVLFCFVIT